MTKLSDRALDPGVAIVILNWNGLADTIECVASVLKSDYPACEIIIVDNGSTDGSQAAIKSAYPAITLVETGQNLGYAEGNNVGMRLALTREPAYLLILNNDTVVSPQMITRLVETSRAMPRAVLGPLTFYQHPADEIWWGGTKWLPDSGQFIHMHAGENDLGASDATPIPCDYVVGSALFAPARLFREIGLFDPLFFLTYEETDWCYRARAAGWRCYCEPRALMWHKVSAAMGGTGSPLQTYFYIRNALLWGERHLPRAQFRRLLVHTMKGAFGPSFSAPDAPRSWRSLRWGLSEWFRRLTGWHAHPVSRATFLGLRDYLLKRFGDCPAEIRDLNRAHRAATDAATQQPRAVVNG